MNLTSVIEQPSFINIDGQKAGTFLITLKDKYEDNALRLANQLWVVYVGDHGYLISFGSTTDQFDSPKNVKIRDDFIKSIRFIGSENATNTNITNRFGWSKFGLGNISKKMNQKEKEPKPKRDYGAIGAIIFTFTVISIVIALTIFTFIEIAYG